MNLIEKLLDYMYHDREYNASVTFSLIALMGFIVLMTSLIIWKKLDNSFELAKITAVQQSKIKNETQNSN